ncbi:DUF6263 family protein [Thalassoroseus pseudoceratinae]|uniref:DUF6263 family protein n=1 Tax=Thalassoroseus pseudoceratinae TaxID=2713176 RepID=UPI00141F4837|nr:DUF6263 family protein [Thalassoroseus pseudoceratinae]
MMRILNQWLLVFFCALIAGGCGNSEEADSDQPAAASTLEGIEPEISAPEPPPARTIAQTPSAVLKLNLQPGRRVPLLKTVQQTLIQKMPQGDIVNRDWLEMLVTLRLEQMTEDGRRKLSVHYERVRYQNEIGGKTISFDSDSDTGPLPAVMLPYRGLVNNGFAFWIGPDHRILKPVGFADFLKRCIRDVPPAQQEQVLNAFANSTEEGVANFVDDSIGYLPLADHAVAAGDTWIRERSLSRPVPLFIQNHCSLSRLTDRIADIDIAGTIATTRTFGEQADHENHDVQVIVRGGHAHGSCRIDRETGLPLHASVKHLLDMAVRQADGREFVQQKITTTTIRLFPEQSTPNSNAIQPASYEQVERSAANR